MLPGSNPGATLAYTPHALPMFNPRVTLGRNQGPIIILTVMTQRSRPIIIVRIGDIVVTIVLRIVIAMLFHAMVLIITIVVVLSVIGITTVMYINSSSSSP